MGGGDPLQLRHDRRRMGVGFMEGKKRVNARALPGSRVGYLVKYFQASGTEKVILGQRGGRDSVDLGAPRLGLRPRLGKGVIYSYASS